MIKPTRELFTARPIALAFVLGAAMAVSTVVGTLIGVLAPFLRAEVELSPARVGFLVAVFALVSGVMAWPAGMLTDWMGGRRALVLVFAGSVLGLATLASAFSYTWLVVAMLIAGLANSAVNPATNRVIAHWVAPGARGLVAGIKMAWVQLAVFAAGVLIPPAAEAFGWRLPLVLAGAVIAGLGILGIFLLVEGSDASGARESSRSRFQWSAGLMALSVYSLLMAGGSSAAVTYIPLYSIDVLGSTAQVGGLAVALVGLLAIGGRLVLGRATERGGRPMRSLALVGGVSLVSAVCLTTAAGTASVLFWVGVVGLGLSALSFIAGTTVALILSMPRDQVGGSSGVMFVGFMIGFGGGPAAFGALVEAAGTYSAGWGLVIGLFALAAVIAWMASRAGTLETAG